MKQDVLAFFLPIALFAALSYFLQVQVLFSPDVGYLIYAANQLLAGGKYAADIFETNPPMILYLYMPICFLHKWLHIEIILLARIYGLFLTSVSSLCCFVLLKKLIEPNDRIYFKVLFYTILVVYFILPMNDILQREHILLIALLPYLLSAALRLENKPISTFSAVVIGVCAGLGFALKPYFLVTFCLIEGFFIIKKRQIFAWVRIESLIISSILVLYFCSIWVFQPDYLRIILPLVSRYYLPFIKGPLINILLLYSIPFCLAMLLSYALTYKQDKYRTIGTILFLGLLGMTIAIFITQAPWYYHVLPAFGLAFIFLMHVVGQALQNRLIFFSMVVMAGFVVFGPIPYCYERYRIMVESTKNSSRNKLIAYINNSSKQHSIFCFCTGTICCFPLVYETQSVHAQRFSQFWWYRGLRFSEKYSVYPDQVIKDRTFIINAIAADLNHYRARWVIIDNNDFNIAEDIDVNLISYLSENKQFRDAWQNYDVSTRIDNYTIYERKGNKENSFSSR